MFTGGMLMIIGGVLEFFLGNTFPFVVFCSLAGFFMTMGATSIPSFGAASAFTTTNTAPAFYRTLGMLAQRTAVLLNPNLTNPAAFYPLWVGVMFAVYSICSIRTNIVLLCALSTTAVAMETLAGMYWNLGAGNAAKALQLQHVSGVLVLVLALFVWYLFFSLMLESVDFPFSLPVGDLSSIVKGKSERMKIKREKESGTGAHAV